MKTALIILTLGLIITNSANASTYSASALALVYGSPFGFDRNSNSTGVSASTSYGGATAAATANQGYLSGQATAPLNSYSASPYSRVNADLLIDDIVISRLTGYESLSNSVNTQASAIFNVSGYTRGEEQASIQLLGSNRNWTRVNSFASKMAHLDYRSAIYSDYTTVYTDSPFAIILSIEGWAIPDSSNAANVAVSLSLNSTVFNLPEGYVANSLNGAIIDNVYVGVSAVPVPAAAWLFASGLLGLMGISRRPRRKSHSSLPHLR